MTDLFSSAFPSGVSPGTHSEPAAIATRLVVALVLGGAVSWIYNATRRPNERTSTFPTTLILLAVLIALVTQIIGDNVARAFSLVGALSIVRFRTVVRDTRDTAFVIFAVVTGMAVGAQNLWAAGIGVLVVGAASFIRHFRRIKAPESVTPLRLTVRHALALETEGEIIAILKERCADYETVSVGTPKLGAALESVFEIRLAPAETPSVLVRLLNRVDGVIGSDCRRTDLDLRD